MSKGHDSSMVSRSETCLFVCFHWSYYIYSNIDTAVVVVVHRLCIVICLFPLSASVLRSALVVSVRVSVVFACFFVY